MRWTVASIPLPVCVVCLILSAPALHAAEISFAELFNTGAPHRTSVLKRPVVARQSLRYPVSYSQPALPALPDTPTADSEQPQTGSLYFKPPQGNADLTRTIEYSATIGRDNSLFESLSDTSDVTDIPDKPWMGYEQLSGFHILSMKAGMTETLALEDGEFIWPVQVGVICLRAGKPPDYLNSSNAQARIDITDGRFTLASQFTHGGTPVSALAVHAELLHPDTGRPAAGKTSIHLQLAENGEGTQFAGVLHLLMTGNRDQDIAGLFYSTKLIDSQPEEHGAETHIAGHFTSVP